MRLDKFQWKPGDLEITLPDEEHGHAHKAAGVRFIPKGSDAGQDPIVNAPEISEAEVDAAVRVWDGVMPAEFRGLLEAEAVEE